MYGFLRRFLPPSLADALTALWYAGLVLLVVYFAGVGQATFRYGEL